MENPIARTLNAGFKSREDTGTAATQAIMQRLQYPHRLSLYADAPPAEITLEDFETFAIDRLQILRALESASLRGQSEEQLKKIVVDGQNKFMPWSPTSNAFNSPVDLDKERAKDHISHYILRLAYCKSEDLRQWFVRHEVLLFRMRWEIAAKKEERSMFLKSTNFDYSVIPEQQKSALSALLRDSSANVLQRMSVEFDSEGFFKVPFEAVPDLVGRRDVYLSEGWAFVPQSCLISVVIAHYKASLFASLEAFAKALPRIDDDDRLKPILTNVSRQYMGKDYGNSGTALEGKITHEDIDSLAVHFAPCMSNLHQELRRSQHLKHMARMQFGLFLKGIGLTMDEALIFWRKAFSKMTDDQFQKGGYAYNIRHNYGQEGKRTNYTPFSCIKIITSNAPSSGDSHGCPFKHFGADNLHHMLVKHGVQPTGVTEIMELSKNGHYQVACTKYYEITRGKFDPHAAVQSQPGMSQQQHNAIDTISHPNQFFELSVEMAGLKILESRRDSTGQKEKEKTPTIEYEENGETQEDDKNQNMNIDIAGN